jgi:hypothetical protein
VASSGVSRCVVGDPPELEVISLGKIGFISASSVILLALKRSPGGVVDMSMAVRRSRRGLDSSYFEGGGKRLRMH